MGRAWAGEETAVAGKRILFFDDRPEFMHQPVLRLRLEGFEVDEAGTPDEARAAFQERGYDLMILDAELPGTDGWKVLQEIRSDPGFGTTKVIVLMAAKGETGMLVLVPVDAELRRPFSMAQLLETVHKVLRG
jgi:DNA-binding response OmpR family regulator